MVLAAIKPDMEIAKRIIAKMESHWRVEETHQGIYRPCYDRAEEEAIDACIIEAKALGLKSMRDIAGNVYLLMEGTDPAQPVILSGSHVDSVPYGGRYDGTAGVVAALSAIGGIKNAGIQLDHGLCVMICRGEESAWFGQVSIGTKFAVGQLPEEVLARPNIHADNLTLGNAMRGLGLHPERLAQGTPLLPLAHISCFIELHIEQGPMLERKGIAIGIVSGIRGNIRFQKIECRGEAGHTGTVPHEMRKDAVRATSRLMTELEDYFLDMQQEGRDLVFTFPIVKTSPAASLTTIPDYCECAIEVRSESNEALDICKTAIERALQQIAARYHVTFTVAQQPTRSAPAAMTPFIQEKLNLYATELGITTMTLPSGAGHDAAVLANAGIPSAMIFIRHDGISHRHDESMDWQDFTAGTELLTQFFCKYSGSKAASIGFRKALLELGAQDL